MSLTDARVYDLEAVRTSSCKVAGPGYLPPAGYPLAEYLGTALNEEWQHRLYAERDLDVLNS